MKFKEAGLGDTATTYVFSALAHTTCVCVTKSGKCPPAANKTSSTTEVTATGTFDPKNGTVSATLVILVPGCQASSPPTCGNGQHLELSEVIYTDISLTDTTHNVSASGLPIGFSKTFFTCP